MRLCSAYGGQKVYNSRRAFTSLLPVLVTEKRRGNGHPIRYAVIERFGFFHSSTRSCGGFRRSYQWHWRNDTETFCERCPPTTCLLCGSFSRCWRPHRGRVQSAQLRRRVHLREGGCELDIRYGRGVSGDQGEGEDHQPIISQRRSQERRSCRFVLQKRIHNTLPAMWEHGTHSNYQTQKRPSTFNYWLPWSSTLASASSLTFSL